MASSSSSSSELKPGLHVVRGANGKTCLKLVVDPKILPKTKEECFVAYVCAVEADKKDVKQREYERLVRSPRPFTEKPTHVETMMRIANQDEKFSGLMKAVATDMQHIADHVDKIGESAILAYMKITPAYTYMTEHWRRLVPSVDLLAANAKTEKEKQKKRLQKAKARAAAKAKAANEVLATTATPATVVADPSPPVP